MSEPELERLLKLYALATRGEGGEASNARRILERALGDTGYTWEDIQRAAEGRSEHNEHECLFAIRSMVPGLRQVLAQLVFSFDMRTDGLDLRFVYRIERGRKRYYVKAYLYREEAALFAIFYPACYAAYAKTYRNMVRRHAEHKRRIKELHDKEKQDCADVFCTVNDLFCHLKPEDEKPDDARVVKTSELNYSIGDFQRFDHAHKNRLDETRLQLKGE